MIFFDGFYREILYYVLENVKINDKIKEAIARMCERHSGEWTTSKKSDIVLPEPENAMEVMIHECDILSSRNNIDMQPPEYLKDIFEDACTAESFDESYTLTFGKFAGKKLIDVYKHAPDYVEWMEKNIQKRDVQYMISAMKEWMKKQEETVQN